MGVLAREKPLRTRETRTCVKLIRLSAAELQIVTERARVSGRPVACYIRESSLGPTPRARRTDLNDSLIRTLAQVATRLTSLAALRETILLGAAKRLRPKFMTVSTLFLGLVPIMWAVGTGSDLMKREPLPQLAYLVPGALRDHERNDGCDQREKCPHKQ